jgi:hypothetical protein
VLDARHPSIDEDWRVAAACSVPTVDPEIMYPHDSEDPTIARVICQECPVRPACLEDGLEEEWGVWGGYTPTERKRLVKYLPTEPVAYRLALMRAAYLGPYAFGVADRRHPLQEGNKRCPSPE